MSTQRYETDIAALFTTRLVISADNAEASILSGSARVRLEGGGVETSNLAEVLLEFLLDGVSNIQSYLNGISQP